MAKYVLFGSQPEEKPKTTVPRVREDKGRPLSDQLFPCSFRGIQFPITNMSINVSHDMAEHRYYGLSAANVEMTGLNPLTIDAEIPLVNGIAPGKNERWGKLFPDVFQQLLSAFMDKTTGYLDTPFAAGLSVKPVSFDYKHDAQVRDGVMATVRWIETIDVDVPTNVSLADINLVRLAAINLDAERVPGDRLIDDPSRSISFEQLVNEIAGIADTATSKFEMISNKPDAILYRLGKVKDSIERAGNAGTWAVREAVERVEDAINELNRLPAEAEALVLGKPTMRFRVPYKMTLSQVALLSTNSVDELLRLNPRLAKSPRILEGTVIRVFKHGRLRTQ